MYRKLLRRHPRGTLGAVSACLLLCACTNHRPIDWQTGPVKLEPEEKRPILSVQIADASEAALLEQEIEVELLRTDGSTLYLVEVEGLAERLRAFGYEPQAANPYEVFRRVVRVERRGSERELLAAGVRLINREEAYWVVEAPLSSLRVLEARGLRMSSLSGEEPRPREVRIRARSREDIQRVAALHVDIYSVDDSYEILTIYAGAFDYQIDALEEQGFEVERVERESPQEREAE